MAWIVSNKDSILYKAADIKLLIPQVKESGGIVPTSSTTAQLALGDALAIATMQHKKFDKLDFKPNPRWALDKDAKFLKGAGVKL